MKQARLRQRLAWLSAMVGLIVMLSGNASAAVANGASGLTASSRARADGGSLCTGTFETPGVLTGAYASGVSVEGVCAVDEGAATVTGNLTMLPGSTLLAAYALNHKAGGTGGSSLTVTGNVLVESGATAVLGCDPDISSFACFDAPELTSEVRIEGSLHAKKPLGVVLHESVVLGSITSSGGGGGENCEYPGKGIFGTIGYPVYSAYEEATVGGNIKVSGLKSCWLGVNHVHVGGSVTITNDQLFDPDAIEILGNNIARNLKCKKDSNTWDSVDITNELWPREAQPNTVGGSRSGQCVLSSPAVEGGELGPGPF